MKCPKILFILLAFLFPTYSFGGDVPPEILREKSGVARRMLEKEKIYTYFKKVKGREIVVAKEILLAVYSQSRDSVELVRLKAPATQPRDARKFIFSVLTPGYKVEWISGRGATRFSFKVEYKNEARVLLDIKTDDANYFPFTEDFLKKEFVSEGLDFLLSKVNEAKEELCDFEVMSRAFPEEKLCEVFPNAFPISLAAMEQTDDGEINGGCPRDDCVRYSVGKFLVHFARNKEDAFSYSVSRTGARGLMQFMNSKKIPTYNFIKQKYPEAKLISDFTAGTRDIKNSIKAAICLLDYDLSILPKGAKEQYLDDPRIGGIFPAAAYNGGPARAIKLYRSLSGREIDLENFKIPKGALKKETIGYLQKYITIWNEIERIFLEKENADGQK